MNSRRDPARWRLVQSALDGLIDLPVHERDAALRTLATQDTALADEVAELLRQLDASALPECLPTVCLPAEALGDDPAIGTRFGAFVVDARIGASSSTYATSGRRPIASAASLVIFAAKP